MTSAATAPTETAATAARDRNSRRLLAACAVLYGLTHHIGFGLAGLGAVGDTRWADWADFITPYAVLLTAAAALHAAQADRLSAAVFLVGAVTYAEGHGIHLAANSVGNDTPGIPVVHLWDEVVGHYVWYAGFALVVAALARTFAHRPAPPPGLAVLLALVVGATWTTNCLEGGTAVMGIVIAAAFTAWGVRTRRHFGRLFAIAFAPALIALIAWGIWHQGFPQPTDLGWL